MNLYGLSAISNVNRARKQIGTGGFLASSTGGGSAPSYYDLPGSRMLPGGNLQTPQGRGMPGFTSGIDIPMGPGSYGGPGLPGRNYSQSIPGVGDIPGEPQVITTQNIPPNDASQLPITSFYLNPQEFGGGPNAPTYGTAGMGTQGPLTAFDPMGYGANPPPNEDVSPELVNTFYGSTAFNSGGRTRRTTDVGAGYPDLSSAPPVTVNAPYGTQSNPYPIPGLGGLPSTYGGGQSWQSNAARSGGGLSGSGYGSGRFAGPSVSFGYGGTMIGSTSGSIFGGNPSHGTILGY